MVASKRFYSFLLFLMMLFPLEGNMQINDSIRGLINLSKNNSFTLTQRLEFAELASELAIEIGNDSIILKSNRNLSFMLFQVDDISRYIPLNQQNLVLAQKINDTGAVAVAMHNLGDIYYLNEVNDSAYFYYAELIKVYKSLGNNKKLAAVFQNLADIQETERDYIGSEENAIEAVKILDELPKDENVYENLWILYNLLAINAKNLNNIENSVEYHQKALDISQKSEYPLLNKLYSLNNLAAVHRENRQYQKALDLYKETLDQTDLLEYDPSFYAMLIHNVAFTKFLSSNYEKEELENEFIKAFHICDTINGDVSLELVGISSDMSKYYLETKQKDSAKKYAEIGMNLAKTINANDKLLELYEVLAQIYEGKESKKYFRLYTSLNDSLINNERSARNKFARIAFETDQLKEEKEQANRERLIFLVSSIALLVTLILLYVIITQRAKNKALAFERQQQEANEEIYNLMLAQQDKIKEGRTAEKKRISEELHDGILSRLFGTRFSLDSLNMNKDDDAIKKREQYIQELQSIEQEIRKISHDLNADFIGDSSFSDILETLVETQCAAYNLNYGFNMEDSIDWDEVNNKTKIHIYRMLQETMQNVYKHAEASRIEISFELKKNVILLTVVDDGKGFNTNKARKGIGLKNFDSRARNIGGKVEIISAPDKGTKVLISIPTRD